MSTRRRAGGCYTIDMKTNFFRGFTQRTIMAGFTLVEVMVTVSIIAILSAIVYSNFNDARKVARDDVRKSDLKELQLAVELYKSQNGRYPEAGCGIGTAWAGPGDTTASWGTDCTEYIDGLVPEFIAALPQDPNQEEDDNRGFYYKTDATGGAYKILVHKTVEKQLITSFADEFARCSSAIGACSSGIDVRANEYAVYSVGAEDW